jgi:hypothetical protein
MKKTNVFIFNSMILLNTVALLEPLSHFLEPFKNKIKLINFTTEEVHREFLNARLLVNVRRTIRQNPSEILVIIVTDVDLAFSISLRYNFVIPVFEILKFAQNENFKGKIIFCSYLRLFEETETNLSVFSKHNEVLEEASRISNKIHFVYLPLKLSEIIDLKGVKTYEPSTQGYSVIAGNSLSFIIFQAVIQALNEKNNFDAIIAPKMFPVFNPRDLIAIRHLCFDKIKFINDCLKVTQLEYCIHDDWEFTYHLAFQQNRGVDFDV